MAEVNLQNFIESWTVHYRLTDKAWFDSQHVSPSARQLVIYGDARGMVSDALRFQAMHPLVRTPDIVTRESVPHAARLSWQRFHSGKSPQLWIDIHSYFSHLKKKSLEDAMPQGEPLSHQTVLVAAHTLSQQLGRLIRSFQKRELSDVVLNFPPQGRSVVESWFGDSDITVYSELELLTYQPPAIRLVRCFTALQKWRHLTRMLQQAEAPQSTVVVVVPGKKVSASLLKRFQAYAPVRVGLTLPPGETIPKQPRMMIVAAREMPWLDWNRLTNPVHWLIWEQSASVSELLMILFLRPAKGKTAFSLDIFQTREDAGLIGKRLKYRYARQPAYRQFLVQEFKRLRQILFHESACRWLVLQKQIYASSIPDQTACKRCDICTRKQLSPRWMNLIRRILF